MKGKSDGLGLIAVLACAALLFAQDGRSQNIEDVLTGKIATSANRSRADLSPVTIPGGSGTRSTDVLLVPINNNILSFDPQNGTYLGVFSSYSGMQWPLEAIQGPDTNIYVSDGKADAIFVLDPAGDYLTCGNIGNSAFVAEFDISGIVYDDLTPATGVGGWGVHRLGNGNYLLSGMGSTHEIETGTGRVVEAELSYGDGRLIGFAVLPPPPPKVDIKVNGQDSGVIVTQGSNVSMTIDIEARSAMMVPFDVWVVARNANNLYFTYDSNSQWNLGFGNAFYTGPLVDMTATPFNAPLPLGSYKAWLGLDALPNGILNLGSVSHFDAVDFQVVP